MSRLKETSHLPGGATVTQYYVNGRPATKEEYHSD